MFIYLIFYLRDVGGQPKIRPLWRHYIADVRGLIFVVNAADKERFEESKNELSKLLKEEELRDVPLLVLANKQDLPIAVSPKEVGNALELNKLTSRKWCIQSTSAMEGEGLIEGLDWMSIAVQK